MVTFLFMVFLVTFSTAHAKEAVPRIAGGENALIESYPYQVSLEVKDSREHFCGGSIITKYHVVTADHCSQDGIFKILIFLVRVRAGTSFRGEGGTLHQALNFISPRSGDIAIIKVKEPFDFDQTRQPIKLFSAGRSAVPGTNAVISGWGSLPSGKQPRQLQAITLPITSKMMCNFASWMELGISKGEICIGGFCGTGAPCPGDSGGPLVIDNQLAGVASRGMIDLRNFYCITPVIPAIYTEIAYFRHWIDKHLD